MLFLMIGEYIGEPDETLLKAHIEWLVPKFESGIFLVSGGLDGVDSRPASAMAILEAESRDDALRILSDEPFHLAGVIAHDVTPFRPRVKGSGLDARFDVEGLIRSVQNADAAR